MALKPKTAAKPKPDMTTAVSAREPRTSAVLGWSPERIRQAELQCGAGNYQLAADLCEAMMPDPRVSKCLDRLYSATTLPLTFQLPGKDAESSKNDPTCQALDADFWKMLPEQTMRSIVAWLSIFWACLVHVDGWKLDEETGRVLPILSVWTPRNLRNDSAQGWVARVAGGSNTWGVEQKITPGDGNWVLFLQGNDYRSPLKAPWLGIASWWLLGKRYAPVDWASSSERHGQGQIFVTNTMSAGAAGLEADVGEELPNDSAKQKVANKVATSGKNGVVVFPRGWQGKLETDGAKTYETFEAQKNAANSEIDMALIGTNLTSEVATNGSRAAAQVHESVDAVKFNGLLELIATTLHDQLLPWWHRYNINQGPVPYPHWDTKPPRDTKAEAEGRKADGEALAAYVNAGAQIDQVAWFEGEVKLIPGATQEIKKPVAPAPVIAPAAPPATPPKAPKKSAALALADGSIRAEAATQTAFDRGREYTDRLEGECVAHAAKELAPTVASVLRAIDESTDYEDAKARIIAAYGDSVTDSRLVRLTEAALIMAQEAGRLTVDQELLTEE
jgi:hypothetical protein